MTKQKRNSGFTLIELMVVMSIVALLMTMVGPLAINAVDKANAKQEMLTIKNWLRKVSYRAFYTGQEYTIKLAGKEVQLFYRYEQITAITKIEFETLFFQPQTLNYNNRGFVEPNKVTGTFQGKTMELDLNSWVNSEITFDIESILNGQEYSGIEQ
ncbi:MAG: type II secretion system protein [Colwellia sp.]|nr:type II secretion system protein [Colwellia sp.]